MKYIVPTIWGDFYIELNNEAVIEIIFPGTKDSRNNLVLNKLLSNKFNNYFYGKTKNIEVKYSIEYVKSNLDKRVLKFVKKIPYGKTMSYSEISLKIFGTKNYSRVIGGVMRRNPIPIIIPCHRVVSKDGSLGGYSAGKEWKQKLLKLEGII